jgi:hypothetical protein
VGAIWVCSRAIVNHGVYPGGMYCGESWNWAVGVIYGTLMFCTDGDSVGDNEPLRIRLLHARPHRAPAGRGVLHHGQVDAVHRSLWRS